MKHINTSETLRLFCRSQVIPITLFDVQADYAVVEEA